MKDKSKPQHVVPSEKTTHTPGLLKIVAQGELEICPCGRDLDGRLPLCPEHERLLFAAPDLLKAAQCLLAYIGPRSARPGPWHERQRVRHDILTAAIAKAEGKEVR